ncbi:hypothetical protein [Lactobacillus phage JCL1032]|uniref:hypothetical protein n=1 Tax=Lactobacillus phage JCL1032 TaxID=37105 RepID=UPI000217AA18|nr:hypothetical protein F367_gp70 [Lactobacillus phage JCL1032]ACB72610.1 hypothetical protein [Lactobacillus phage JCL1032]
MVSTSTKADGPDTGPAYVTPKLHRQSTSWVCLQATKRHVAYKGQLADRTQCPLYKIPFLVRHMKAWGN